MALYLITGPPAAGKSTWVKQNAESDSITIDYDAIANSFKPGDAGHDHPSHIRTVARSARRAALDEAVKQSSERDVYVIHSLPNRAQFDKYRNMGAQVVVVDPGRDVVTDRVSADRPELMKGAVEQWYETTRHMILPATQQDSIPKRDQPKRNAKEKLAMSETTENKDIPVTVTPSPLDMPGARKESVPPAIQGDEAVEPKRTEPQSDTKATQEVLSNEEREELDRLRNFRKQSRDWERTAKSNYEDAQRFRQMMQQLGGEGEGEPDPLAEVNKLRDEVESERRERVRERVARETGVPPSQITGSDEESMKESAEQALSWAREFVKQSGVPLAAPASNVNSDGKPHDDRAGQIKSRDELRNMSPGEITQAYREGRLDSLMGKAT